jgi:hypothetical protein
MRFAKAPQHPTVKSGCLTSWMVFLSLEQYFPSLPMGHDMS